jgi:VanZ family protein
MLTTRRSPWYTFVTRWGPVVLGAGVIFGLSSISGGGGLSFFPHADKLAHLVVYFGLGLLLIRAIASSLKLGPLWCSAIAVAIGALYGVSDEIHQSFVPGRAMEGLDLLADTLGVTLACLVWFLLVQPRLRRRGDA